MAADLVSKQVVFDTLLASPDTQARAEAIHRALVDSGKDAPPKQILHQLQLSRQGPLKTRITLSTNPGVVFGLRLPRLAVLAMTIVTMGLIGAFFAFSHVRAYWSQTAFGLILAGAIGNLYDRLFAVVTVPGMEPIRYQVRDFLDFSQWGYPWIFNIADVWLVAGVVMIMITQLTARSAADTRTQV